MTDRLDIVYYISDNFAMPLAVSIKSVIEKNSEDFKYIVFHIIGIDLSSETKKKLKETAKPLEIKFYDGGHIDKVFNPNIHAEKMILPAYSRLLVGEFLDGNIEKCIMLDADTICINSLKGAYEECIKDFVIAGVIDIGVSEKHKLMHNMLADEPYINIGFLLINLKKWRDENILEELKAVSENYPLIMRLEEMDLINITIKKKKVISLKYNFTNIGFYKIKNLEFFYKGYSPYGKKDYYSIDEIIDAKNNIVIYHYGGYYTLSPLAGNKKDKFYKAFINYKNKTPYKDLANKNKVDRKQKYIAIIRNFCFIHLPFPLLKIIYSIFHATQESQGTV
ncbi:MAG: hypothetical protein LBD41_00690 [Clostridiales Family XIII bacterium]|jgi:lipopolysaccharide biosynthesis glycosyltransferase|nr:hypothetical protein [Clostridiales Family XIII bacterium]